MFQNCSLAKRPRVAHMFNLGWWRLVAVGGWRLAVGGGWRLAVGGWWRLVGLAVGGLWGRSLTAVSAKKIMGVPKGPPWRAMRGSGVQGIGADSVRRGALGWGLFAVVEGVGAVTALAKASG